MPEKINYTKLINLINEHQYKEAFKVLSSMEKINPDSFSLILIKLFLQIEMEEIRSAKILIDKLLKIQPEHQLLKNVSTYLNSDKKTPNPLDNFIGSLIQYNHSGVSKLNEQQFNQLMDQILIKPYIK